MHKFDLQNKLRVIDTRLLAIFVALSMILTAAQEIQAETPPPLPPQNAKSAPKHSPSARKAGETMGTSAAAAAPADEGRGLKTKLIWVKENELSNPKETSRSLTRPLPPQSLEMPAESSEAPSLPSVSKTAGSRPPPLPPNGNKPIDTTKPPLLPAVSKRADSSKPPSLPPGGRKPVDSSKPPPLPSANKPADDSAPPPLPGGNKPADDSAAPPLPGGNKPADDSAPPPLPGAKKPTEDSAAPPLPGKKQPANPGGNDGPPGLPGKCVPPGDMPVTPDTCQIMQTMCGCDKFPRDPKEDSGRLRIPKDRRVPYPSSAPGIESYSNLGYCTGVRIGPTKSYSAKFGELVSAPTRRYTLRLKRVVEPATGRTFLRTQMDDQYDERTRKMRHCGTLSQIEDSTEPKIRPINAPPLFFVEGETAEITVINESEKPPGDHAADVNTSIHWHGIILPNDQDGIVDITQTPIPPGGRKVYRFNIEQNGTYWYHPHDLNEQDTRGAIVIFPDPDKEAKEQTEFGGVATRYHHDRLIMLTDYKKRETLKIFNYLRDEDRNAYETDSRIHKGWLSNLNCWKEYLDNFKMMRMFWMDRADVWYDSFFMNDETCLNCGSKLSKIENLHTEFHGQTFPRLNEFSTIKAGERTRLRLVNGSASSYFFLDYANTDKLAPEKKLEFIVVAKDGLAVKPFVIDQLYMGMGETYDVLVEVPENGKLYELRAKSIDDITNGRVARTLIGYNPLEQPESTQVVSGRNVPVQICGPYPENQDSISQINYSQLEAPESRTKAAAQNPESLRPFEIYHSEKPIAEYYLSLSGSMEDYHWKISGENGTQMQTDPMHTSYLTIKEDHRIRISIKNDMVMGMMNHPWHLHGNWFRIIDPKESDEQIAKKALLHTATIYPGQTMILEFYADPLYRGAWMFHCHNLYHMANDMMMYLRYDTVTDDHMNKMNHFRHHHTMMDDILPAPIAGIKNQYVVAVAGVHYGTEGLGPSINARYRGTLGNNAGFVDINMDLSGNNLQQKNRSFEIFSRSRYCFEVNKCVFLDFRLHNPEDQNKEISTYVGGQYKPWNSELLVLESGAGAVCRKGEEAKNGQCSLGLKNVLSSTWDAGWNTRVTGRVGCEGEYCKDFFGAFQAAVTPHPRITIVPINCKISTNKDETACFAEVRVQTDPIPVGRQH